MRKGIPPKAGSCAGGRGAVLAFETRPNPPDKPPNPPKRILKIIRNEICSLKHRRRMCPLVLEEGSDRCNKAVCSRGFVECSI